MPMFDPATISAALGSVKTILDVLRNANDAQLAMRILGELANVQGKLLDVQQQAIALQNENHGLREEIRQLKTKLEVTVQAAPCPKCLRRGWRLESSAPDPRFGVVGVSRRQYKCEFCGFTESKLDG